ncbi:MAG: DUF3786 domain-containing protein [Syntrophobacterales bacterium]|nr:DUF3786 domain-containing protein [Syntrophobacterales bacterium]
MIEEELWLELENVSPQEVAVRAIAEYYENNGTFAINVFNKRYVVDVKKRLIVEPENTKKSGLLDEILLHYLSHAQDVPLSNNLISPNQLTDGSFFFRASHELPLPKLADKYGSDPNKFIEKGLQLGGERADFGDAAVRLRLFPRVPLIFALWKKDEEFDSEVRVILDSSVEQQMSLYGVFLALLYSIGRMLAD